MTSRKIWAVAGILTGLAGGAAAQSSDALLASSRATSAQLVQQLGAELKRAERRARNAQRAAEDAAGARDRAVAKAEELARG